MLSSKQIISGILENNDEDTVKQLIDDLKPEYVSDGWEDEFEDIFEAYDEQGRGEAESQILNDLLEHYFNENSPDGSEPTVDEHCKIIDAMKEAWSIDY